MNKEKPQINYPKDKFKYTKQILSEGASQRQVARELGVDNGTIIYWIKNNFEVKLNNQHISNNDVVKICLQNSSHYSYILGSYLGDGHITKMSRTYRLRIFNDVKYPDIISDQIKSLSYLFPENKIHSLQGKVVNVNCMVVVVYSLLMPLLFPQHGPGAKHTRDVSLKKWQWDIVKKEPECFIKGLIDSDGCCYTHTQPSKSGKKYFYKKYAFTNSSNDIIQAFSAVLSQLNIDFISVKREPTIKNKSNIKSKASTTNIYINRRPSVSKMDEVYLIAENKIRGTD